MSHKGNGRAVITNMLRSSDAPTAVVCGGGSSDAQIMVELAATVGKRVPEDMSIVAFGGPLPERRPITATVEDEETLGTRALEMLLEEDMLSNPRRVLVPARLAVGNTTAPPRAG